MWYLYAMAFEVHVEPVPITFDEHGVARVGDTRVGLDVLIAKYHQGATAEDLARKFPVLSLGDIYGVLAFYHNHRDAVDAYLDELSERQADVARAISDVVPDEGFKARLQARSQRRE